MLESALPAPWRDGTEKWTLSATSFYGSVSGYTLKHNSLCEISFTGR
jgi:hypothetical protein